MCPAVVSCRAQIAQVWMQTRLRYQLYWLYLDPWISYHVHGGAAGATWQSIRGALYRFEAGHSQQYYHFPIAYAKKIIVYLPHAWDKEGYLDTNIDRDFSSNVAFLRFFSD